jgi:hypothetical protein
MEEKIKLKELHIEEYPNWADYYYVVDGTYYFFKREAKNNTEIFKNVNEKLIHILERCRKNNTRIRVWYGSNSKVWLEEYDVIGRINRTTGRIKIPILLNNKRSFSGEELLVHRIVRIDDIKEKKTIYKLDGYEMPNFKIREVKIYNNILSYQVLLDNEIKVIFNSLEKAQSWVDFMTGKRYRK